MQIPAEVHNCFLQGPVLHICDKLSIRGFLSGVNNYFGQMSGYSCLSPGRKFTPPDASPAPANLSRARAPAAEMPSHPK